MTRTSSHSSRLPNRLVLNNFYTRVDPKPSFSFSSCTQDSHISCVKDSLGTPAQAFFSKQDPAGDDRCLFLPQGSRVRTDPSVSESLGRVWTEKSGPLEVRPVVRSPRTSLPSGLLSSSGRRRLPWVDDMCLYTGSIKEKRENRSPRFPTSEPGGVLLTLTDPFREVKEFHDEPGHFIPTSRTTEASIGRCLALSTCVKRSTKTHSELYYERVHGTFSVRTEFAQPTPSPFVYTLV